MDGGISKTDLGWNINCSWKTNCPSAMWIRVNNFASNLIRGAIASPPLRTFELWPQWYLRKARMQYWGLLYCHMFLFCLLFDLLNIQSWGGSNHLCIPNLSVNTDTQTCTKEHKPVQIQRRKPDMSCDLTRLGAKLEKTNLSVWNRSF